MKPKIIAAQKERPKIDRKFAELKRFPRLRGARYWVAIQFTLIAIACNLKGMVKLLFHRGCLEPSRLGNFQQEIKLWLLPFNYRKDSSAISIEKDYQRERWIRKR